MSRMKRKYFGLDLIAGPVTMKLTVPLATGCC
jgi:hypothetical protein